MSDEHSFLLEPGNWLGTGTLGFSGTDQTLNFYARWAVGHGKNGSRLVQCTQTVEIEGGGEQIVNRLRFSQFQGEKFCVLLENALMGTVHGSGVIDPDTIAWEYRDPEQDFEGFEVYEKKGCNDYEMRAEYASEENARTFIKCKLWKEQSEMSDDKED